MQLRDHEGIKGKRDAYPFDPRLLKITDGYNVRDLETPEARQKLEELKESIRANGVKVPLEVRFDGAEVFVIAGHRRHKAAMELIAEGEPIETVLIIAEPKGTNDAERTLNLAISNSGEPLKPLEVAEIVRRLTAFGWDKSQIAKRMGWKSPSTVSQHLDMLAMPAELQQAVKQGNVSATMARRLEAEQPGLAAQIIADAAAEQKALGKKPRATPKAIKKATGKSDKLPIPPPKQQRETPAMPAPIPIAAFVPLTENARQHLEQTFGGVAAITAEKVENATLIEVAAIQRDEDAPGAWIGFRTFEDRERLLSQLRVMEEERVV